MLESLRTHRRSLKVQRVGLRVLGNLAADSNNRRTIAEAGGIELALEALRTHPKDMEVQREGLGAIAYLRLQH